MRQPVYWLLVASFVSFALFYTALLFNLVPMLREAGFTTAQAVAVYACIGPSQVAGRIVLLTMERWLTATIAGIAGTTLPVAALLIFGTATPGSLSVYAFAIAFGAGMGIKTIVQATAAPEFLGREGYGALQGSIVTPIYAAQAVSPFAAAMIWQAGGGYHLLERVLLSLAFISAVAFASAAVFALKSRPAHSPSCTRQPILIHDVKSRAVLPRMHERHIAIDSAVATGVTQAVPGKRRPM